MYNYYNELEMRNNFNSSYVIYNYINFIIVTLYNVYMYDGVRWWLCSCYSMGVSSPKVVAEHSLRLGNTALTHTLLRKKKVFLIIIMRSMGKRERGRGRHEPLRRASVLSAVLAELLG